jgi:hypothetical protein
MQDSKGFIAINGFLVAQNSLGLNGVSTTASREMILNPNCL